MITFLVFYQSVPRLPSIAHNIPYSSLALQARPSLDLFVLVLVETLLPIIF